MSANYWARSIRARTLSRRRALALAATGLSGAALLAACGGDDDGGGATEDKSGLLFKPEDTTSKAVAGGTLTFEGGGEPPNVDPISDQQKNSNTPATYVYGRFLKYKVVPFPGPASLLNVEGDMMQSWEKSPDGLTWTFKIRQGVKWDTRTPTNGRDFNMEDVKYSWDKHVANNFTRGVLFKSASPDAPIDSFGAIDANTFQIKLAYPFALIEHYMGFYRSSPTMIPVEAEDKVNLRNDMRGTGAWMLERHTPSVSYEFVRNPNYYVKGRPFVERLVNRVIPEYSQRLAQLQAGNIDWAHDTTSSPAVRPEDALSLKQNRPQILMQMWQHGSGVGPSGLGFGFNPGSPFLDVRVRRALNMLFDRDAFIDTIYNVSPLKAAGLPVDSLWHSHMGAGDPDYWIDPRNAAFGEGSQYFKFDPAGAKALLKAAGVEPGYSIRFGHSAAPTGQAAISTPILAGFLEANGDFKVTQEPIPPAQSAPLINQVGGAHEGLLFQAGFVGADLDQHLSSRYVPSEGSPTVLYAKVPVPPEFTKFIDLLKSARREGDQKKRIEIIRNQVQKEMAIQMPAAPVPGVAPYLTFAQPWVGNWYSFIGAHNVDTQEVWQTYWYDASKKTS